MVGGEGTLDQVHRLLDGHNHFIFGVTFKSTLVRPYKANQVVLLPTLMFYTVKRCA